MTKKHFIALADSLRLQKPLKPCPLGNEYFLGALRQWESMRNDLANFYQSQNPNFNRERWLAYIAGECGPNGGKVAH